MHCKPGPVFRFRSNSAEAHSGSGCREASVTGAASIPFPAAVVSSREPSTRKQEVGSSKPTIRGVWFASCPGDQAQFERTTVESPTDAQSGAQSESLIPGLPRRPRLDPHGLAPRGLPDLRIGGSARPRSSGEIVRLGTSTARQRAARINFPVQVLALWWGLGLNRCRKTRRPARPHLAAQTGPLCHLPGKHRQASLKHTELT